MITALLLPATGSAVTVKTIRVQDGLVSALGGWKIATDSSAAQARLQLGVEDGQSLKAGNRCVREWSFRGVRIEFREPRRNHRACIDGGFATSISVWGLGGRLNWQTDRGLQVGDKVKRLRALYPSASFTAGRWELHRFPSVAPWGPGTNRFTRTASAVARVSGGSVKALVYSALGADAIAAGLRTHLAGR